MLGIKFRQYGLKSLKYDEAYFEIVPYLVCELYKNFYLYHETAVFMKYSNYSDTLTEYDSRIHPDFGIYEEEAEPVMGYDKLFDVRTDRAFISYKFKYGKLKIGRDYFRLGPAYRNALFLSGYSRPINFLYNLFLKLGKFNITTFSAVLTERRGVKAFLAKRIELNTSKLIIGVEECAICSIQHYIEYFNPIDLYYISQRHGRGDANLACGVDANFIPTKGINIYSEIFLDDPIIFSKTQPFKAGGTFGLHLTDLFGTRMTELRTEFTAVPRWVYTHRTYLNAHSFKNNSLGFWAGCDAIDSYLELTKYFTPLNGVKLTFEYFRHGTGRLNLPWDKEKPVFPNPRPEAIGLPSGIVDTRVIFEIRLFTMLKFAEFQTGLAYYKVINYKNIENKNINYFVFKIFIEF